MAENYEDIWSELLDMNWKFDDRFNKCFLDPAEVARLNKNLSVLRRIRYVDYSERGVIVSIIQLGRKRYNEFKEHIRNQPRRDAQKFIGKKNIREFIFKRDDVCLCCGKTSTLSIDHIVPVNKGGANKLMNLQTLCRSCNSSKSDNIIDYR